MASLVPMAGSAYTYGYATMGELVAWIIGWDLVLEYALGAVTVAIGWSGHVVSLPRMTSASTFPPGLSAGADGAQAECRPAAPTATHRHRGLQPPGDAHRRGR